MFGRRWTVADVTLRIEPVANLDKPTGHVASLRLPIPLSAMKAMSAFFVKAYGPDATMREEPKGWIKVELPNNVLSVTGEQ